MDAFKLFRTIGGEYGLSRRLLNSSHHDEFHKSSISGIKSVNSRQCMNVSLLWTQVRPEHEDIWYATGVVYAYTTIDLQELLYIGKATTTTVSQRWSADDKSNFWGDLEEERGIYGHQLLVGELELGTNRRLSRELLSDVESLLICNLQPWGNIQSRLSRISRPGMVVRCCGEWPYTRKTFRDN